MAVIETIHRCLIEYNLHEEFDVTTPDRVYSKALKFTRVEGENVVELHGCRWRLDGSHYLVLQSSDYEAIERVAGKIERYIKRLKAVELCPTG